jgi:hypothetical protein
MNDQIHINPVFCWEVRTTLKPRLLPLTLLPLILQISKHCFMIFFINNVTKKTPLPTYIINYNKYPYKHKELRMKIIVEYNPEGESFYFICHTRLTVKQLKIWAKNNGSGYWYEMSADPDPDDILFPGPWTKEKEISYEDLFDYKTLVMVTSMAEILCPGEWSEPKSEAEEMEMLIINSINEAISEHTIKNYPLLYSAVIK